jgi:hypothetical protein
MVNIEGSAGTKKEGYYTILPTPENVAPNGVIKYAPADQAEDDSLAQNPPDDDGNGVENSLTNGKIHYLRLQQHNFVDRQGLPNQRKSITFQRIPITTTRISRKKPPAHQ